VLDLVLKVCKRIGVSNPPALFIDHGQHYDETLKMLTDISNKWKFKMIYARNEDVLKNVDKRGKIKISSLSKKNQEEARRIGFTGTEFDYGLETEVGNHLLKTVAMNEAIEKYRFDALFTGVRWDENEARSKEVFISPRVNPAHVRVQPILPFTERNVWEYIFKYKLPMHPLYKQGYRSIDGKFDSKKTSDIPAWEQDLEHTKERAGRSQDKEGVMEKLRIFGYM
jgi:3''-phosphoadenosine 5''-phosphosulfate sulfotransferase (PAPS reductase)/FAD synthetase and related enzymes